MVMTHAHSKYQGQTDGRRDGRTQPITLPNAAVCSYEYNAEFVLIIIIIATCRRICVHTGDVSDTYSNAFLSRCNA